jgi:Zn-dependent protease with chaperone function
MGFEGILNQIFQPYFYYSVIFLVVSFACVKILTQSCGFIGQRTKSLLYLIPLVFPIAVMLAVFPSTGIQTTYQQIKAVTVASTAGVMSSFPFGPFLPLPPHTVYTLTTTTNTVVSVTGIMCYIGLIAGGLFALSMVLADDRIARKVLHVILLSPKEHQWLQTKVVESSRKLTIAAPKIGVVEDLRPNAFTIGYGRKATIVFSIGLLNILNKDEIAAVASHELAHVKNHDFFFKVISNALTTVSFFNPLAYISCSTAQREREMLADERAVELLEKPSALADALAKICKAIQNLPKESVLVNFSSNLLVTSSVLHRVGILSTHPRLDTRLRNISTPKARSIRWSRRNTHIALLLSLLLILSAIAVSLAMVDLQLNFTADFKATQHLNPFTGKIKGMDYQMASGNATFFPGVFTVPFNGTQPVHVLVYNPDLTASIGISHEMGYNVAFNTQGIPFGEFIVVPQQDSSWVQMREPASLPAPAWIG